MSDVQLKYSNWSAVGFLCVTLNPTVMERLQKEIKSVMENSGHPTRVQIRKMPYLACVIKESSYSEVHAIINVIN